MTSALSDSLGGTDIVISRTSLQLLEASRYGWNKRNICCQIHEHIFEIGGLKQKEAEVSKSNVGYRVLLYFKLVVAIGVSVDSDFLLVGNKFTILVIKTAAGHMRHISSLRIVDCTYVVAIDELTLV
jgi:hypothetical protein